MDKYISANITTAKELAQRLLSGEVLYRQYDDGAILYQLVAVDGAGNPFKAVMMKHPKAQYIGRTTELNGTWSHPAEVLIKRPPAEADKAKIL